MPEEIPTPPKSFDWQKFLPLIATAILSGGGSSLYSSSQSSALEIQTKLEAQKLEVRTQERITNLERQVFQLVTIFNLERKNILNELPLPDKYQ